MEWVHKDKIGIREWKNETTQWNYTSEEIQKTILSIELIKTKASFIIEAVSV